VEVTEKVDGSQFVFGLGDDGALTIRSKGQVLDAENVPGMFLSGYRYVLGLHEQNRLVPGVTCWCEYLDKPKHNTIAYERTPTNGLMLFGAAVGGEFLDDAGERQGLADALGIDAAPVLETGSVPPSLDVPAWLDKLLDTDSYLGGSKIEGVVIKNYARTVMVGDVALPLVSGKYVSEAFKERHQKRWRSEETRGGRWASVMASFRTEARWEKAVQHLRDDGRLTDAPQDIGMLIKEVVRDITDECEADIRDALWREFKGELFKESTRGLPEWYKRRLAGECGWATSDREDAA
jgi:hypothetical protein